MVGTFTLLKYTIYYCLLYRNIGFNLNVNIYWTPDFVFFWCIFWLNLHKGEYLRRKISVFFRQHAASIYGFVRQSASECVKKKLHSVWLQLLLLLLLLLILLPHSGPNWEFQPYLKSCKTHLSHKKRLNESQFEDVKSGIWPCTSFNEKDYSALGS